MADRKRLLTGPNDSQWASYTTTGHLIRLKVIIEEINRYRDNKEYNSVYGCETDLFKMFYGLCEDMKTFGDGQIRRMQITGVTKLLTAELVYPAGTRSADVMGRLGYLITELDCSIVSIVNQTNPDLTDEDRARLVKETLRQAARKWQFLLPFNIAPSSSNGFLSEAFHKSLAFQNWMLAEEEERRRTAFNYDSYRDANRV